MSEMTTSSKKVCRLQAMAQKATSLVAGTVVGSALAYSSRAASTAQDQPGQQAVAGPQWSQQPSGGPGTSRAAQPGLSPRHSDTVHQLMHWKY